MPDGKPAEHDILALMARPGGAEILCGGTLALLRERGYGVHIAVVSAGDSGAGGDNASEAARTRVAEARSAAGRIRAGFTCFGRQDFHVTSLYPIATWERLMTEAGFRVEKRPYPVHEDGRDAYLLIGIV